MKSTLLLLTISFILAAFGPDRNSAQCSPESLVFYRLTVYTFWSQQAFPKHFPDTRPVAQWSKLYGASHTENLTLFQVGRLADKSLQTFAELGKTEDFESTLNHSQVLSTFYAPPIKKGVGLTSSSFFVNAEYSKISFVMKIHPSPDWFIGVDSLDLCQNGTWLHNQTIEAIPMDAGTDQGFTFTSPDYANEEPEPVFRIGLTTPDEPYGSFYYKNLTVLPTMAQFVITKVQEYTTKTYKAEHHSREDNSNNETSTVNLNNKNQTENDTKNELSVHDKTTEKTYEDEKKQGDKNSKGKDDKSGDRKEQGDKHKNVKEKQNKTPEGKDIKEHESSEEKELKTSENGTKQKDKPKNSEEKESKVENGKQRKGSKDKNNQHRTSKRTRSAKRKSADSRRTRDCKSENKKRHAKSKHSRDLIEMDLGRKKSEEITDLERTDLNRDIGYARKISPEQITNLESRHLNSEMDLSRKKSKEDIRDLESRETKVRRRKKLCVVTSTDVRNMRIQHKRESSEINSV